MLFCTQILSMLFSIVFLGQAIKVGATRFDKITNTLVCVMLIAFIVLIEVMLK